MGREEEGGRGRKIKDDNDSEREERKKKGKYSRFAKDMHIKRGRE